MVCDFLVVVLDDAPAPAAAVRVVDDDTEAEADPGDSGVNIMSDDDAANLFLVLLSEFEVYVEVVGEVVGGGVCFDATATAADSSSSVPEAEASKNSSDERQCLIFFLERVDDEEAAIAADGVVGEDDTAARGGWGRGDMVMVK